MSHKDSINEVSQTGYYMVLLHSKFKPDFLKTQINGPKNRTEKHVLLLDVCGYTFICTKCRTHYISIRESQWDKHSRMYTMLQPKTSEPGYRELKIVDKVSPKRFSLYSHSLQFRILKYHQDHKLRNKTYRILTYNNTKV